MGVLKVLKEEVGKKIGRINEGNEGE